MMDEILIVLIVKPAFGVFCFVLRVFGALSAGGWLPSALALFVFLFRAMLKGGVCVLNLYICLSLNVFDIYYACLCVFEYLVLGLVGLTILSYVDAGWN